MRSSTIKLIAILIVVGASAWSGLAWLENSYREKPYSLIEDGLYLGQIVYHPPAGTEAVVNLCGTEDPYTVTAKLWAPVMEGGREASLEWFAEVADFIDEQRRAGRTVYVHCLAGVNRSPAALAAYLMRAHGWDRERAVAFIRSKRPQIHPNPELMHLLDEWGAGLTKR